LEDTYFNAGEIRTVNRKIVEKRAPCG
jgi:hypothetical protein